MISSMTGYGRGQCTVDGMDVTVEIKSVNHRYFEFSARTPRNYLFLEEKLKNFFSGSIARGKVECFVQIASLDDENVNVSANIPLAKSYLAALKDISENLGVSADVSANALARYNDVLEIKKAEVDEEKVWNTVKLAAEEALNGILVMRRTEGEKLKNDVLSRLDFIAEKVAMIESRSPETVREYSQKLLTRMKEALGDNIHIDEQRILTEAAIYADKVAVAEETVRLSSHMSQLKTFLVSDEAIGRKMDFLVQEMNREANTIGSKAQDVDIARAVLDIKAEIEKIREQIQNIE
ncbi:MAG: YicC family protein [Ruminococcaceae bacterium]|nr:YicC family protein [Oscillospiraceae bacterium]